MSVRIYSKKGLTFERLDYGIVHMYLRLQSKQAGIMMPSNGLLVLFD